MIDWSSCTAVERDPERVTGAWVFVGSRVSVAALFENLDDGAPVGNSLNDFLAAPLSKSVPYLNMQREARLVRPGADDTYSSEKLSPRTGCVPDSPLNARSWLHVPLHGAAQHGLRDKPAMTSFAATGLPAAVDRAIPKFQ